MRRLRAFLVDELLLAQAVPGFVLCVGWAVMYEIYHEDGSFYTTLMQEILGGDGLFPYFLVSAILMAFPVGLVMDTVREIVLERWLKMPRPGLARRVDLSPLQVMLQPLLPLHRFDDRYALYRHARAALLTPAKASGNMALVLVTLLVWFVVKIIRMSGWHVFSLAFIIGTPVIGLGIVATLIIRYAAGLAEYRRLIQDVMATASANASATPVEHTPPPLLS
jgi:hypothetical protein